MQYVILALMVIAAIMVFSRALFAGQPGALLRILKIASGLLAGVLALFLAATGRIAFAVPFGALALSLLLGIGGTLGGRSARTGHGSQVKTQWLEMWLDHESGAMSGTILAGRWQGRLLDDLSEAEAIELLWAVDGDPQSRQLMEAYLDRRSADWRSAAGASTGARDGAAGGSAPGPMTRQEAFEILGLKAGASKQEIQRAHRELMKHHHPDQGGSTYLATKINEAKDLLLG